MVKQILKYFPTLFILSKQQYIFTKNYPFSNQESMSKTNFSKMQLNYSELIYISLVQNNHMNFVNQSECIISAYLNYTMHGALQQKDIKAVLAQVVSCCVYDKLKKIMQHMYGIIPCMLDYWAEPVVHLLLPQSSMVQPTKKYKV